MSLLNGLKRELLQSRLRGPPYLICRLSAPAADLWKPKSPIRPRRVPLSAAKRTNKKPT